MSLELTYSKIPRRKLILAPSHSYQDFSLPAAATKPQLALSSSMMEEVCPAKQTPCISSSHQLKRKWDMVPKKKGKQIIDRGMRRRRERRREEMDYENVRP
jgi:hypothetical protein